MIGVLIPFHLDPLFARIDQSLDGGTALGDHPFDRYHCGRHVCRRYPICLLGAGNVGFSIWNVLRLRNPVARHSIWSARVLLGGDGFIVCLFSLSRRPLLLRADYGPGGRLCPANGALEEDDEELVAYGGWYEIRALDGQEWLWSFTEAKIMPEPEFRRCPVCTSSSRHFLCSVPSR